jgi:hypothetical protein
MVELLEDEIIEDNQLVRPVEEEVEEDIHMSKYFKVTSSLPPIFSGGAIRVTRSEDIIFSIFNAKMQTYSQG